MKKYVSHKDYPNCKFEVISTEQIGGNDLVFIPIPAVLWGMEPFDVARPYSDLVDEYKIKVLRHYKKQGINDFAERFRFKLTTMAFYIEIEDNFERIVNELRGEIKE